MGQTSIGSTNANMNENHPHDDNPSKTFGAEGGGQNSSAPAVSTDPPGNLRFDGGAKPTDAAASGLPGEPLESALSHGVPVDPEAYPDGPNIDASPCELEAARGNTKLKP